MIPGILECGRELREGGFGDNCGAGKLSASMLTSSTSYVDMVNMDHLKRLWTQNAPLTATTVIMLLAFVGSVLGMAFDPRTITGVRAWLKPAKFAISTAIFSGTIAWLYGYLTVMPRLRVRLAWILSIALNLEVAIIDLQAFRGTTSHFNFTTTLNGVLFGVMGIGIAALWIASVGVFVVTMRQKFSSDPAWGWALRLGMFVTVLGAASGGLMLRSTPEQLAQHVRGGHTVGAPDGGPGLPGIGWSSDHGDLRIAHFLGLHGIQVIPFIAFVILRNRAAKRRKQATPLVFLAAGSYLALILILTWQALRGESIVQPGGETLAALGLWLAITAITLISTQLSTPAQPAGANS